MKTDPIKDAAHPTGHTRPGRCRQGAPTTRREEGDHRRPNLDPARKIDVEQLQPSQSRRPRQKPLDWSSRLTGAGRTNLDTWTSLAR